MRGRRAREGALDRLLREALADDLSRDVQGRLRTSLGTSWRTAVATPFSDGRLAERRGAPGLGWTPQRALLAVAALVALAVGGVVHLEAGAGTLAESFLARQTAARVVSQLRRVSAMSCRLEAWDPEGRARRFLIEWHDTGVTKVGVEGPEGVLTHTLHLPREAASLLARARARDPRAVSWADGPVPRPAAAHLTPERIAGLLAGQWERVPGPNEDRPRVETFRVSAPGRRAAVRITIDRETGLPLSLEQDLRSSASTGPTGVSGTHARFVWTLGPTTRRPLSGRDRPAAVSGRPDWS